ncbi:MAG: hypothetical protein HQL56_09960 [Magnetococcales bacterium]|nr:hypothetical protein [Magnetococcales bacterium]
MLEQSFVSEREFTVTDINTYTFGDQRYPEFTLLESNKVPLYLMVGEQDLQSGVRQLTLSGMVSREDLQRLFDLEELERLFEQRNGSSLQLHRKGPEPPTLRGWTAEVYQLRPWPRKGIYFRGDYRGSDFLFEPGKGEGFDYHLLSDAARRHALEIEIYEDGDVEIFLSVMLSEEEVVALLPGEGEGLSG